MKITQEIYDTALFLSRCVYYEMEGVYPKPFDKCLTYEGKFSGLKMNVFDMEEYHIIVLCGTNDFHDVIADIKVGLCIVPRQYKTAVDATYGRRTRAVLIMDSGHIILSAVQPETVGGRIDKTISQEDVK